MKNKIYFGLTTLTLCLMIGACPSSAGEEEWKQMNLDARDLFSQGKPREAIMAAEAALSYARQHLGDEHLSVPKTLNNLGVLYFTQKNVEKAESYYQQALEMVEKFHGNDHTQNADILVNLSRLYAMKNRFGEAVSRLERALKIQEKEFGSSSKQAVMVMIMLRDIYARMGLTEEARQIHKRLSELPPV